MFECGVGYVEPVRSLERALLLAFTGRAMGARVCVFGFAGNRYAHIMLTHPSKGLERTAHTAARSHELSVLCMRVAYPHFAALCVATDHASV